jgi:hypothetical protein
MKISSAAERRCTAFLLRCFSRPMLRAAEARCILDFSSAETVIDTRSGKLDKLEEQLGERYKGSDRWRELTLEFSVLCLGILRHESRIPANSEGPVSPLLLRFCLSADTQMFAADLASERVEIYRSHPHQPATLVNYDGAVCLCMMPIRLSEVSPTQYSDGKPIFPRLPRW